MQYSQPCFINRICPALQGLLICVSAFLVSSCSAPENREENAREESAKLERRTEAVLGDDNRLTLGKCLAVASEYNLKVRQAAVRKQIAELERGIAFSRFLPRITSEYKISSWYEVPKVEFSFQGVEREASMQDKTIQDFALNLELPIFQPSAWVLYSLNNIGVDIAELADEYTSMMVQLQVVNLYFAALSFSARKEILSAHVSALESLRAEVQALYEEGLVPAWRRDRAEAIYSSAMSGLRTSELQLRETKASLLSAMGLSPGTEVKLASCRPFKSFKKPVEELILEGLLENPRLHIADRNVEISRGKVRLAIADFLPELLGFGSGTWTSNSRTTPSIQYMGGFQALMTVFSGFSRVNEYRKARRREKLSFLEREKETLGLMLEVRKADLLCRRVREKLQAFQKEEVAKKSRYDAESARWEEGFVRDSELLEASAELKEARLALRSLHYKQQSARAALLCALGRDLKDIVASEASNAAKK